MLGNGNEDYDNITGTANTDTSSDNSTTTSETTSQTGSNTTTTNDTSAGGGSSGGGYTDDGTNGTSNINGTTTVTNSDDTTTTTNTDGTTTTNNLDGSTTTSATDPDGTEHYSTTGEAPYPNDTTNETVTHNDDGTNTVDSTTAQSGGYTVSNTDNGDGTYTTNETTPGGTEVNSDPPKDDNRTTDAHNQLDPNGQSVEPAPATDDSNPPADPNGDGNEDPEGDPNADPQNSGGDDSEGDQPPADGNGDANPPQGEQESSGNSAQMSAGGMDGDPGMDGEHAALPPGFGDILGDSLKGMHLPSHDGDTINVIDTDGTGTASGGEIAGPVSGPVVHDSPMDPAGPNGEMDGGGHFSGSPGSVPSGPSGDIINDLDQGTQSNGPEERQPNHDYKPSVPSSGGGTHIGLPDAPTIDAGGKGGDSHAISQVGEPVETRAQQLAHELKDAVAQQDDGPHDVLKGAAEKVAATVHAAAPLVHGVSLEDGNHFADFIKAAQAPLQSGLMTALQPTGTDALHHLDAGGETSHDLGLHSADDLHAVVAVHAAPAPVPHDSAVEHITAPVSVEHLWHH